MRILYFSDAYAHDVMGTKRSIKEEVERQGHAVKSYDKGETKHILQIIKTLNPDQVWLAHSALTIPESIKSQIKIPIIGFGFSDPYYFTPERLMSYTAYVTNNYETYLKFKSVMPMHYNPTACDFNFHDRISDIQKPIDVSCIGVGIHPRFNNAEERVVVVDLLRRTFPKMKINCYGKKWNKHPKNFFAITGEKFLKVIRTSKLGLDIQDNWSPLAHRMFEYTACGTPVITRDRPEVNMVFEPDKEIITYTDHKELFDKIDYYVNDGVYELRMIAEAGYNRCRREHDIIHRVGRLLSFSESVKEGE